MEIKSSKTKLFLIELIIIILFFAIAAVVCMNIFAAAKITNVRSTDATNAMFEAQGVAEAIRAGGLEGVEDVEACYYDADWQRVGKADARYTMEIRSERADGMLTCDISVTKAGEDEAIYTATVKHFEGTGGQAA